MTNRKHHCRNCGQTFDQNCSSRLLPLPHLGINTPVRVDDGCYFKLVDKASTKPAPPKSPSPLQPRDARVQDNDDEDLKLALQMSLEESQRSGNVPKVQQPFKPADPTPAAIKSGDDEEDANFKAAIEASLRDLKIQPAAQQQQPPPQQDTGFHYPTVTRSQPRDTYISPKHAPLSTQQAPPPTQQAPPPTQQQRSQPPQRPARQETLSELSSNDIDNISLFATLIEKMLSAPPGTILREPRIQELYESIETLRPRLNKSLSSTIDRYESLLDMHSKLTNIMRSYDKMLEDRLSTTYNYATYNANDTPQEQPFYQQRQQSTWQQPKQSTPQQLPQRRPSFPQQQQQSLAATPSSSSTHAPPLSPPIPFSSQSVAARDMYEQPDGSQYKQSPAPVYGYGAQPQQQQQQQQQSSYDQHYFPNSDYRQHESTRKQLANEEPASLIDL